MIKLLLQLFFILFVFSCPSSAHPPEYKDYTWKISYSSTKSPCVEKEYSLNHYKYHNTRRYTCYRGTDTVERLIFKNIRKEYDRRGKLIFVWEDTKKDRYEKKLKQFYPNGSLKKEQMCHEYETLPKEYMKEYYEDGTLKSEWILDGETFKSVKYYDRDGKLLKDFTGCPTA